MKFSHIFMVVFMTVITGCASMSQQRKDKILDCTKDMIGYDASPGESYMICKDLYTRQQAQQLREEVRYE